MTLHPTHTCFDDALDFFDMLAKQGNATIYDGRWRLVHALCEAPDGQYYAHAWVERDDIAIGSAIIHGHRCHYETDRRDYYRRFRPVEMNRYTVREAVIMNARHNNFGPWESRYRDFASSERRTWI